METFDIFVVSLINFNLKNAFIEQKAGFNMIYVNGFSHMNMKKPRLRKGGAESIVLELY